MARLWDSPRGEAFKIGERELPVGRFSLTRRSELVFSGLFDPAAGPAASAAAAAVVVVAVAEFGQCSLV